MITIKELDKLQSFGKESDREYSDRKRFTVWRFGDDWELFFLSELDGSVFGIKTLKDMNDFRNVYKAITDKELV